MFPAAPGPARLPAPASQCPHPPASTWHPPIVQASALALAPLQPPPGPAPGRPSSAPSSSPSTPAQPSAPPVPRVWSWARPTGPLRAAAWVCEPPATSAERTRQRHVNKRARAWGCTVRVPRQGLGSGHRGWAWRGQSSASRAWDGPWRGSCPAPLCTLGCRRADGSRPGPHPAVWAGAPSHRLSGWQPQAEGPGRAPFPPALCLFRPLQGCMQREPQTPLRAAGGPLPAPSLRRETLEHLSPGQLPLQGHHRHLSLRRAGAFSGPVTPGSTPRRG